MTMVQGPIENRGREDVVTKDSPPLRHQLIRRDQQAAALIPTRDELKKQMRAPTCEFLVWINVPDGGTCTWRTNASPRQSGVAKDGSLLCHRGVQRDICHPPPADDRFLRR